MVDVLDIGLYSLNMMLCSLIVFFDGVVISLRYFYIFFIDVNLKVVMYLFVV